MTNWFIQSDHDQEDLGPFRPSELLQKVRAGEVTRDTKLRKDDSAWFDAGEVGGLFEAAMRPTIEYFCPQCKHARQRTTQSSAAIVDYEIQVAITKITENSILSPDERSVTEQAGQSVQNWLRKKRAKRKKGGPAVTSRWAAP